MYNVLSLGVVLGITFLHLSQNLGDWTAELTAVF